MDNAILPPAPLHVSADDGRAADVPSGRLSALLMAHGSMELHWYAPAGEDRQVPHDRDEIYVVAAGSAFFVRAEDTQPFGDDLSLGLAGEERVAVKPGDALFVPAGTEHRFEAASPDFGAWMLFYGPEGGETS